MALTVELYKRACLCHFFSVFFSCYHNTYTPQLSSYFFLYKCCFGEENKDLHNTNNNTVSLKVLQNIKKIVKNVQNDNNRIWKEIEITRFIFIWQRKKTLFPLPILVPDHHISDTYFYRHAFWVTQLVIINRPSNPKLRGTTTFATQIRYFHHLQSFYGLFLVIDWCSIH